jgi:hypothetical protein
MSYLSYLWLFADSDVLLILHFCFVFPRLVYSMFASFSGFSRYSLTFICSSLNYDIRIKYTKVFMHTLIAYFYKR